MNNWSECKHILCIRADNMGDVLMSTPAIAALKYTFNCKITVLTSSMGAAVCTLIPEIDEVIKSDLPWVKLPTEPRPEQVENLTADLKLRHFDGCVIFTVYSQSSLPAAFLAFMAGIPLSAGYCRENPYHLITHWLPDPEPYHYILHQVERDLQLVQSLGASTPNLTLRLCVPEVAYPTMKQICLKAGINVHEQYMILHAGVSEAKRKYPEELWIEAGQLLLAEMGINLVLTGSAAEWSAIARITAGIGKGAFNLCGQLSLPEFAALISHSSTLISVNTGTVHLAAAMQKPLVVLYARTNPQHLPWMVSCEVLEYSVPRDLKSKNPVITYVNEQYYPQEIPLPSARQVVDATKKLRLNSQKESRNCLQNEAIFRLPGPIDAAM